VETKIEGKRGFHLMGLQGHGRPATSQSSESEPGWGVAATSLQVNIVPTQGAATPAPALLHNCCTLNLNLQLHKCCSHGLTAPGYRRIAPLAGALRRASCCLFTHPVQELLEGQGRSDMEAVTLEAHTPRSQTSIPVTKKRQYDQKRDEKRIPKET